jgi:hypothetical protein
MSWTARQRCGFCQRVCQRSCDGSVQHAIGRCPECDWPISIEDGDACERCGLTWEDRPDRSPAVQLMERWYSTPETPALDETDFPPFMLRAPCSDAERELSPAPDRTQRALVRLICQVLHAYCDGSTWQEDETGFALSLQGAYYGHVTCEPLPTSAPLPEQDLAGALLTLLHDMHARHEDP